MMGSSTSIKSGRRSYRKVQISQDRYYYIGGVCYHGRKANGKLGWKLPENRSCIELVRKGLGHDVISRATGLTKSQIAYRCKKIGVSVMDFRRGQSDEARKILRRYTVTYD